MDPARQARGFRAFLARRAHLYVQTHDYPDPDAIAAAFGLARLARALGTKATIVYAGEVGRTITSEMIGVLGIPLVPAAGVPFDGTQETLVVDGRAGGANVTRLAARYVGEIDHHQGPVSRARGRWHDVRPGYGATSSIVGEYWTGLGLAVPRPVATALCIGVNTDTLRFLRGASDADLEIYPALFRRADRTYLQYVLMNNIELKDLAFFKRAIGSLTHRGRLGLTELGLLANSALLAISCDFLLQLKEIDVVLALSWTRDKLWISVRSESADIPADSVVHKLVEGLGAGGGHKTMAAGSLPLGPGRTAHQARRLLKRRFFALRD